MREKIKPLPEEEHPDSADYRLGYERAVLFLESCLASIEDVYDGDPRPVVDTFKGMLRAARDASSLGEPRRGDPGRARDWPPRLSVTVEGVIALWCRKHGHNPTREQIDELAGFVQLRPHYPVSDGTEPSDGSAEVLP